ncbi:MAG: hypothetical protein AB199_01535 [Parcubacteria bacterium C7867-004]|nr:MAG: hypothetical protein AB199_01535 [Parcubacteria bacterium C7867-004]
MNTNTKFLLVGLLGIIIGMGGATLALHERGNDSDDGHRMADGSRMRGSMSMQGEMDGMMQALDGKTGDAFDQAFLKEMIVHHQGAVAMAEAALKNAKHQEIKDLAQGIISAQNSEIQKMGEWQKSWYGK